MDRVVRVWRKARRDESGVVFVEAAIVFPVIFFVIFFLLFTGNLLYQRSEAQSEVEQYAIIGASACADSIIERAYRHNGALRLDEKISIEPYRFLRGNSRSSVVSMISEKVASRFHKKSSGFFPGMKPVLITPQSDIAHFNNYFIYATFDVEIEYEMTFPIRFLGDKNKISLTFYSRAEMPVSYTTEFIRNTDMVIDYLTGSGVMKKVSEAFGKVKTILSIFD